MREGGVKIPKLTASDHLHNIVYISVKCKGADICLKIDESDKNWIVKA